MSKWKQTGGDVSWDKYGLILTRINDDWVEVFRLEPAMEHDKEMAVSHGFWFASSAEFKISDLEDWENKEVKGAASYVGMDKEEWAEMPPEGKAEAYATYGHWDQEETGNDLNGLLPGKPEDIEFSHGKETKESLEDSNAEMRREALEANFDTSLDIGEMPDDDALEFAWGEGDHAWEFEINDNEKSGLGYAKLFSKIDDSGFDARTNKWTIDDAKTFAKIVESLAKLPTGDDITPHYHTKIMTYLGHPEYGDKEEEKERVEAAATEFAESAQELAVSLMGHLGFDWR